MDSSLLTMVFNDEVASQQKQADEDIKAINNGIAVIRSAGEAYFSRLRLRVAEDPSLSDKITVLYNDGKTTHKIGLKFKDELHWPPGFLTSAWDEEVAIQKIRMSKK